MSVKRRYEIINPSDKIVITSDNELAAIMATLVLGIGKYGLERVDDGERVLPIFLAGGAEAWFAAQHGITNISAWMDAPKHAQAMAEVLDTAFYARGAHWREDLIVLERVTSSMDATAKREEFKRWNEGTRTSSNDLGIAAHELADAMRRIAARGDTREGANA